MWLWCMDRRVQACFSFRWLSGLSVTCSDSQSCFARSKHAPTVCWKPETDYVLPPQQASVATQKQVMIHLTQSISQQSGPPVFHEVVTTPSVSHKRIPRGGPSCQTGFGRRSITRNVAESSSKTMYLFGCAESERLHLLQQYFSNVLCEVSLREVLLPGGVRSSVAAGMGHLACGRIRLCLYNMTALPVSDLLRTPVYTFWYIMQASASSAKGGVPQEEGHTVSPSFFCLHASIVFFFSPILTHITQQQ